MNRGNGLPTPPVTHEQRTIEDDLHGLERTNTTLAHPAGSGETPPPLGEHPAQRVREHGLRAGTGGTDSPGNRTRSPAHATLYLETRLGYLTYAELAQQLALAVQAVEQRIEAGEFDAHPLDETLILTLHNLICGELTSRLTGWRQKQIQVGTYFPPDYCRIPLLMHEYTLDLQARLAAFPPHDLDHVLETLAFAEGRLLSIHPFADFNGRTTRVFLRLLLRKLDLPVVRLAPPPDGTLDYLEALRAADRGDWSGLAEVWEIRFQQSMQEPEIADCGDITMDRKSPPGDPA